MSGRNWSVRFIRPWEFTRRPTFAVTTVPLGIGRKWILLTDGFVEARNTHGPAVRCRRAWPKPSPEARTRNRILCRSWKKAGDNSAKMGRTVTTPPRFWSPMRHHSRRLTVECEISPETIPDLRFFCEQWVALPVWKRSRPTSWSWRATKYSPTSTNMPTVPDRVRSECDAKIGLNSLHF